MLTNTVNSVNVIGNGGKQHRCLYDKFTLVEKKFSSIMQDPPYRSLTVLQVKLGNPNCLLLRLVQAITRMQKPSGVKTCVLSFKVMYVHLNSLEAYLNC